MPQVATRFNSEIITEARKAITELEMSLLPDNPNDYKFEPDPLTVAGHANSVIHRMEEILTRIEGI